MADPKVLLFYVSENSGHHRAALALEEALSGADTPVRCRTINTLRLTNPVLENLVLKTYLGIVKNTPEIWDYLYDNHAFKEKIDSFRKFVHRVKAAKLLKLLETEQPQVLVCTQAFPCGLIADRKARGEVTLPLIAVITDFTVHAYWVYKEVDLYIVPCQDTRMQLVSQGIPPEKIQVLGIPVSPRFTDKADPSATKQRFGLSERLPLVLVMGGGHGLGPIEQIVRELDRLPGGLEIVVVTGTNKALRVALEKNRKDFQKRVTIQGYLSDVAPLMSVAEVLIGKAGGLTISEAMASTLPMILIDPLPGQEMRNTEFLLREKVAVLAHDATDAARLLQECLDDPSRLESMREKIKILRKPDAGLSIAQEIIKKVRVPTLAL